MKIPNATQRRLRAEGDVLPAGSAPEGSRGVILGKALQLFAERGFGSASIRDLASLVGIKSASLYSHYPSKTHVLADLMRIGHEEHFRRIRQALLDVSADPKQQLIALVRAHVLVHAQYPMLAVVANSEMHVLPPEFAAPCVELRRQSESFLIDIIRRGVAQGVFDVEDPELALTAIGAMGLRVANWYTPELGKTPEQVADGYALYACRIVGAKA